MNSDGLAQLAKVLIAYDHPDKFAICRRLRSLIRHAIDGCERAPLAFSLLENFLIVHEERELLINQEQVETASKPKIGRKKVASEGPTLFSVNNEPSQPVQPQKSGQKRGR